MRVDKKMVGFIPKQTDSNSTEFLNQKTHIFFQCVVKFCVFSLYSMVLLRVIYRPNRISLDDATTDTKRNDLVVRETYMNTLYLISIIHRPSTFGFNYISKEWAVRSFVWLPMPFYTVLCTSRLIFRAKMEWIIWSKRTILDRFFVCVSIRCVWVIHPLK